ncbi:MAG: pyrophosphatase [Spirochaetota bacterium]
MLSDQNWLIEYSKAAAETDALIGNANYGDLILAGLFGEAGSILAEFKKQERDLAAYPYYKNSLREEIGDFLWYFFRCINHFCDSALIDKLRSINLQVAISHEKPRVMLGFAANIGALMKAPLTPEQTSPQLFLEIWQSLKSIEQASGIELRIAAQDNLKKSADKWPKQRNYHELFDDDLPDIEQLPRKLRIEFRELNLENGRRTVILRCNEINFGARLTDNIQIADDYRFHDIFHFAYLVYLGWSPVVRSLLNCKRKSRPELDENQDGARAAIIEEAISASVFAYAKNLRYFEGLRSLDYTLLKMIHRFSEGFEVFQVSLWQWEQAVLKGYEIFRQLRENRGGFVITDLKSRSLEFSPSR